MLFDFIIAGFTEKLKLEIVWCNKQNYTHPQELPMIAKNVLSTVKIQNITEPHCTRNLKFEKFTLPPRNNLKRLRQNSVYSQFETNNPVEIFASDVRKTSLLQHIGLLIKSKLWNMNFLLV